MLVVTSYTIPLVISLITMVVEFTAPVEARYRPQFDTGKPFFHGELLTIKNRCKYIYI